MFRRLGAIGGYWRLLAPNRIFLIFVFVFVTSAVFCCCCCLNTSYRCRTTYMYNSTRRKRFDQERCVAPVAVVGAEHVAAAVVAAADVSSSVRLCVAQTNPYLVLRVAVCTLECAGLYNRTSKQSGICRRICSPQAGLPAGFLYNVRITR